MNAQPNENDRSNEEQTEENLQAAPEVASEAVTVQPDITVHEEPSIADSAEFGEIDEVTEISGNGVPQPMAAGQHVNSPLIEPMASEPPTEAQTQTQIDDANNNLQWAAAGASAPEEAVQQQPYGYPSQPAVDPTGAYAPTAYPVGYPGADQQQSYQQPYGQQPYSTAQYSPYYQEYPIEPLPPTKRSNRVFGLLMAVLGVVLFAGLYFGALILLRLFDLTNLASSEDLLQLLAYPRVYFAIVGFAVVFLLLALLGNRIGWWYYVLGGCVTALGAGIGYLGGRVYEEYVWYATVPELGDLLLAEMLAPLALILAMILGREVPVWIGAINAARGRRLVKRYEQELSEHQALQNNAQTTDDTEGARSAV